MLCLYELFYLIKLYIYIKGILQSQKKMWIDLIKYFTKYYNTEYKINISRCFATMNVESA